MKGKWKGTYSSVKGALESVLDIALTNSENKLAISFTSLSLRTINPLDKSSTFFSNFCDYNKDSLENNINYKINNSSNNKIIIYI